jgi:hypothetical protein
MQNDRLGYPPRSEQQATRLEQNLSRSRSTCDDSNVSPVCRAAIIGWPGVTLQVLLVPVFGV